MGEIRKGTDNPNYDNFKMDGEPGKSGRHVILGYAKCVPVGHEINPKESKPPLEATEWAGELYSTYSNPNGWTDADSLETNISVFWDHASKNKVKTEFESYTPK